MRRLNTGATLPGTASGHGGNGYGNGNGSGYGNGARNGAGRGGARGPVLITGGAGFIGANLADRLLSAGEEVIVLDNFSRPGVERNLIWLERRHGARLCVAGGDIRDDELVRRSVQCSAFVYHLAAQVDMTKSLQAPVQDHSINVQGTLNVLEAIRRAKRRPGLVFASTNKVYGALGAVTLRRDGRRYEPVDEVVREHGVDERQPLEFLSPYGCSKGAADQYVLDYCRSFGLPAVVLRMSCVYGPHQQASGDQGWVTHFLRSALEGVRLTIYGDGCQVRDILYIDDFIDALLAARRSLPALSGAPFNIGGGPRNVISLLELVSFIEGLDERKVTLSFEPARTGDQLYFAADHRRFTAATGWRPRVSARAGVNRQWQCLGESARRAEGAGIGPLGTGRPGDAPRTAGARASLS